MGIHILGILCSMMLILSYLVIKTCTHNQVKYYLLKYHYCIKEQYFIIAIYRSISKIVMNISYNKFSILSKHISFLIRAHYQQKRKGISGESGYRSRYLSHAKRALYHLS